MPGIDFDALRKDISILEVLQLLDFQCVARRGERLRGVCPMGCSQDPRVFVVNVNTDRYYCQSCHCYGNQLELWSETQGLPFFQAVENLCHRLHIDPPRIRRW